jgi:gliding motility-associated-like protein
LLLSEKVSASHLMGGEITWTCQGTGQFVFTLKLYRDCNNVSIGNSLNLMVYNHPTVSLIPVNLVSQTDISPVCNAAGPAISCALAQTNPPVPGAVEEFVFRSAPIFLGGTPPPGGWIFSFVTCCRNASLTNIANGAGQGMTIRSIMYPYNSSNTNPCYDNSPEFLERPAAILCAGAPFSYNQNAVDVELDSLAYSFAEPLNDTILGNPGWNPPVNPQFLPYNPGFSASSPMPGTTLNPSNVPATIDPITGQIDFTSFTTGNFVTCIRVQAWKCGQLVAEIFREMRVVVLSCGANNPPTVSPPLNGGTTFSDTVYAGAVVNFQLCATDLDLLPNSNPQTVSITATGNQFGTNFTNAAAGCLNPPCATLTPPPPVSAPVTSCVDFNWQTSCNHINTSNPCYVGSNVYNFVFQAKDDFCPAPSSKFVTISITVLSTPPVISPNVHCLAVAPNGDVTLTWDQPLDTANTFNSYHIFSSTNPNGPFTVVDSIFNYNQLTYTHVGANANNAPVYYTVQTRAGCAGMQFWPPLDTMSTIFLQVINNNNGTATLNWNNISVPAPGSQFGQFHIYREYPTGVWTLLDSTAQLTYMDSIAFCGSQVNYRIEIYDTLGCWSVSNVAGDFFTDATIPPIPGIDSVSVDANGNAVIGWQPSTTSDVGGYVVYQYINGIWTAVDTLYGINNTSYLNLISNADQQSELYAIAAFDTCGNISAFSAVHHTLLLNTYVNICNSTCYLTWNNYINMNPGVTGYDVYVSVNGGPFGLLGSTVSGDTTFDHTGLLQNATYCYFIVANNQPGSISSSSNVTCIFSSVPQQPAFQYLRVVTVSNPNEVTLIGYVDNTADIQGYNVMRADTNIGPFDLVGFIPFNSLTTVSYVDYTARTEEQSYYYQLVAVDSCGHPTVSSNVSRTMYCKAIANTNFTNTVIWNDYETWMGGISQYNIYRYIDGVFDPSPVATVPYSGVGYNVYIDDVSAYSPSAIGLFTYVVEAEEGLTNPFFFVDSSYSNTAEAPQLPLVYVPNAFTPNNNGNNDIFIPSTGFIDVTNYDFRIYNRWGEQIFATTDRTVGWDGKIGSKKCDSEVYVWSLTFQTATGQYIDMVGTVTLVR